MAKESNYIKLMRSLPPEETSAICGHAIERFKKEIEDDERESKIMALVFWGLIIMLITFLIVVY